MPLYKLGQPEKARLAMRRAVEVADRVLQTRPDDVRALYLSGESLIHLGEPQRGLARLDQAVSLMPEDFAVLYNAACGYAKAGNPERALDLLDRAVGKGRGFRVWIERDQDLDGLPRYQQILGRLPQ